MKINKSIYIISFSFIIVSIIIGVYFKSAIKKVESINVTGSAKRDFESDIIVWKSKFST